MRTRVHVIVAVLCLLVAGGCKKSEPKVIPQPCLQVEQSLKDLIHIPRAAAVKAPRRDGLWFVAGPRGAIWLTNSDPTDGVQEGSVTLPLNDQARAASFIGGGVQEGSDAFQGTDEKEAKGTGVDKCPLR